VACLAVATTLLGVAACGNAGPGTSAKTSTSVQVWALQDAAVNPIAKASIGDYNKATGDDVALTTYVNDAYKQKLQVAMGSPNAPDVFFNWGGGNLAQFVNANQVVPLDSALAADPQVAATFLPSVMNVAKINGKQYGLPMLGVLPVELFYNKAVFAANNLQPPTTYDQLLTLVDTLKAKGITPIALPGKQGWTELMYLEYLLDRVGGPSKFQAIAAGTPGAWTDPAVVQALQMCQDLAKRGAFGTNFASVDYDNSGASKLFATGKAAMFLMGSWEYPNQQANNPTFFASGNFAWTAFPSVAGGAGDPADVVGNPSNYYSVAASSKHQAASIDFLLKTLTSDQYINGLISAGQVPATTNAASLLAGKPNAEFNTFTYNLVAKAPSFTQSWDQALSPSVANELITDLQKLFLQQMTPAQFAADMAAAK
jgi:raffinose/stachyose/melibiose transport system substrate-binding protein/xylobiose transport system substrate-binding protein